MQELDPSLNQANNPETQGGYAIESGRGGSAAVAVLAVSAALAPAVVGTAEAQAPIPRTEEQCRADTTTFKKDARGNVTEPFIVKDSIRNGKVSIKIGDTRSIKDCQSNISYKFILQAKSSKSKKYRSLRGASAGITNSKYNVPGDRNHTIMTVSEKTKPGTKYQAMYTAKYGNNPAVTYTNYLGRTKAQKKK